MLEQEAKSLIDEQAMGSILAFLKIHVDVFVYIDRIISKLVPTT